MRRGGSSGVSTSQTVRTRFGQLGPLNHVGAKTFLSWGEVDLEKDTSHLCDPHPPFQREPRFTYHLGPRHAVFGRFPFLPAWKPHVLHLRATLNRSSPPGEEGEESGSPFPFRAALCNSASLPATSIREMWNTCERVISLISPTADTGRNSNGGLPTSSPSRSGDRSGSPSPARRQATDPMLPPARDVITL